MTSTTTTTEGEDGSALLLKTDVLGRVKTPKGKREALLDEFEKSGMSGQAFAQWAGIKYTTFANWVQMRRKRCGPKEASKPAGALEWVEARLPQSAADFAAGGVLSIQLPGGGRMEITGIGQVALAVEVLRRLEGKC